MPSQGILLVREQSIAFFLKTEATNDFHILAEEKIHFIKVQPVKYSATFLDKKWYPNKRFN